MVLYYGFSFITLVMLWLGYVNTGWLLIKIFIVASIISVFCNIRYIVNITNANVNSMFYYVGHGNYIVCVVGTVLMLVKSISGYLALYLLWSEVYHIFGICKVMYIWIMKIREEYNTFR